MGYNGQTEHINSLGDFSESTTASNSSKGSTREAHGGGDVLYKTDVDLVRTACGDLRTTSSNYFLASRVFLVNTTIDKGFYVRVVAGIMENYSILIEQNGIPNPSDGSITWDQVITSASGNLRPIVILKNNIQAISGDGTESNPWKVN